MKILHLADLHLGRTLYGASLLEEQEEILNQVLKLVHEEQIDAVIIAGDIFDKKQPSQKVLNLYNNWLNKCTKLCSVIAIAGNHDNAALIEYGSEIFAKGNYYPAGELNPKIKKVILYDNFGPINFYLLPYYNPYDLKVYFPKVEDFNEITAFRTLLKEQDINQNERNVLLLHAFITGKNGQEPLQSESESLRVGLKDELSYTELLAFDYVALGHLHRHQVIGDKKICYAGSPYPYSFSEAKNKYFVILDFGAKGEIEFKTKKIKTNKQVEVLRGMFDDLIEQAKLGENQNYLQIEITQSGIYQPYEKLKKYYPNLLHIMQESSVKKEIEEQSANLEDFNNDPITLFEEYYQKITDKKLTREQQELVREIFQESELEE